MALTAAESKELYQFFAVAFNAAPGVEYMNQLYDARNSGMTMEQVVEAFTTKTQFTNIYPNFLTNETFASRLVDNVVGDAASASAKASAAADIVAALALGWSRGKVIYTIFGNLANKAETDATWGTTAKQFNNQVAVAQYYTETLLVNTTDVTKLQAVIANVTATTDVSSASAIENVIYSSGGTTDVASELTTTAGETVTGTPGNDVFAGTMGVNLQDGDAIRGGSGTDTLNLRANSSGVGITTLQSVETVNLNLRASATLDALNWSGTTTVAITTDSVAGTSATITNADLGTTFAVNKSGTTLEVSFADLGDDDDTALVSVGAVGAQGATVTLNGALEAATVTSTGGTGTLTLDASATSVTINGSGDLTIDLTADVVSGISTTDFAGDIDVKVSAASTLIYSGGAANDVLRVGAFLNTGDTLVGGAGDDTLYASLDGSATLAGVSGFETGVFVVSADVTTAAAGFTSLTFSGGTAGTDLVLNGLITNSVTLALTTATDVTLNYTADTTSTITLSTAVDLDDVLVSGAETVTLTGNASNATMTIADLRLNEADTITLSAASGANLTLTGFSGRQAETVTLSAVGTGSDLVINDTNVSGVQSLTLSANGKDATVNLDATAAATGQGVTVVATTAGGSGAKVEFDAVTATSGSLSFTATVAANTKLGSAGEDLEITGGGNNTLSVAVTSTGSGNFALGSAQAGASGAVTSITLGLGASGVGTLGGVSGLSIGAITVNAAAEASATLSTINAEGSGITSIALDQTTSGTIIVGQIDADGAGFGTLTISGGSESDVTVGAISTASGLGSITVNAGTSGTISIGAVSAVGAAVGPITVTIGDEGNFSVGNMRGSGIGAISITAGNSGTITLGQVSAATDDIGQITITGGVTSDVSIDDLRASGTIAGVSVSVGASGNITIGSSESFGTSAGTIGDVTLIGGDESDLVLGEVSGRSTIGNLSFTVGASASLAVSGVTSYSASVGNLSITAGNASIASAVAAAETSFGDITISGSGTFDLVLNIGTALGTVGDISVLDGARGSGNIEGASVGDVTMNGHGFVLNLKSAASVGDVTYGGSAGSVTFVSASIGAVVIDGAGAVTFNFGTATSIDSIATSGHTGTVTLDLDSVLQTGVVVTGGASGLVVQVSTLGDAEAGNVGIEINLASGAGKDVISIAGSAYDGAAIQNFQFGSALDIIRLSSAGFQLGVGSAAASTGSAEVANDIDIINVGSAGETFVIASAAGEGSAATDVIVVTASTGFESFREVLDSFASAGSLEISIGGAASAAMSAGEFMVVWYNASEARTELTLVQSTSIADVGAFFSAISTWNTIATFSGDIRTFGTAETFTGNLDI